jgi:hypothetical protein
MATRKRQQFTSEVQDIISGTTTGMAAAKRLLAPTADDFDASTTHGIAENRRDAEAAVNEGAPAVVNPDGTPTKATIDMLQHNGRTSKDAAPKQARTSRPQKVASPSAPVAKAGRTSKPTAKAATPKKVTQRPAKKDATQADKVRAFLLKDPSARPVDVQKATGVPASYVWDIRAAMHRKGTIPTPETASAK